MSRTHRSRDRVDVRIKVDVRTRRRRLRAPGLCPRCERFHRVMRDGMLAPHMLDDHALCPGSGQKPEGVH